MRFSNYARRSEASSPVSPASPSTPVARWRVGFLCFLMLSWEGVVPAVLGLPPSLAKYLVSIICIAGVAIWFSRWINSGTKLVRNDLYPVLLCIYCSGITILSSYVINNYPFREWLFAQYMLCPLLIGFLLNGINTNWREIITAFVVSATICSIVSVADQLLPLSQFDQFMRNSINNRFARRMFLMRVETGLSIVILTTWLLTHWKIDRIAVAAIFILSINTFVLFRISESRQSIATVLLSIFYFVALGGIRAKKLLYVMTVGLIASFPLIYFLAGDYISKFLSSSNYIADGNVEIRLDALDFYLDRFWDTGGLGFGVLSNGDDATNFFATSARVGNGSWQYLIADIGIFSPLVQFGWIGLFVVVFLTLRLAYMFITTARRMGRSESVLPFAFGCFLLGSMLHPWPMNYFTLEWTIMFGSLTWFTCNDLLARYPRKSPTAILPAQSRSLATA